MIHPMNLPTIKFWPRWLLAFSLVTGILSVPVGFLPARAAEKPEYYEQVYLSQAEALKTVFGDLKVRQRELTLSPEQRKELQRRLRRKIPEQSFTLYEGYQGSKLKRYALILNEKGKHFPITFIVALSPEATVQQVAVMVYRERRGDGVKRQRFLNQFVGKDAHDPIEINADIVHITGSTISSWSIAAGVRKAVLLVENLVLKSAGSQASAP